MRGRGWMLMLLLLLTNNAIRDPVHYVLLLLLPGVIDAAVVPVPVVVVVVALFLLLLLLRRRRRIVLREAGPCRRVLQFLGPLLSPPVVAPSHVADASQLISQLAKQMDLSFLAALLQPVPSPVERQSAVDVLEEESALAAAGFAGVWLLEGCTADEK